MPDSLAELICLPDFKHIANKSQQITLPADSTVFRQGDNCNNYLMVIKGSVKVFSRAENGREVLLYRVKDGESCTLTTACLFARNAYPAEGITEVETTALMLPLHTFNQGLAESELFRSIIFNQYARRLSEVITVVEELSFGRLDIRLARLLLQSGAKNETIETTHQSIATELGSAREVVSRELKKFEQQGLITLHRGSISILDLDTLQTISNSAYL